MRQSQRENLLKTIALKIEKDALLNECDTLTQKIEFQKEVVKKLKAQLRKLSAGVEKFDQPSLKNLYFSIKGTKEQRAAKEQKELGASQLALTEAQSDLFQHRNRLEEAQNRITQIDISEYKLVEISRKNVNDPTDKALSVAISIASNHVLNQKIEEAILLAKEALESLENGFNLLDSASGMGVLDGFGGKGVFAQVTKQNRLQKSSEEVLDAQKVIHRFNQEVLKLEHSTLGTVQCGRLSQITRLTRAETSTELEVQSRIFQALDLVKQHQLSLIDAIKSLRAFQESEQKSGRELAQIWHQINVQSQSNQSL